MGISVFRRSIAKFKRESKKNIDSLRLVRLKTVVSTLSNSPDFPASDCNLNQYFEITTSGMSTSLNLLLECLEITDANIQEAGSIALSKDESSTAKYLQNLFLKYGSDKGQPHNYHLIYGPIFSKNQNKHMSILEIGLGSNYADTPSNMGITGKPGASLRAWSEYNNGNSIIGLDVDERVLFQTENISTYHLDQTNEVSWDNFLKAIPEKKFDLVIDDGLHSPHANLRTIRNLLPKMNKSGVIIIEDIAERSLPYWLLYSKFSSNHQKVEIIKTKLAYVLKIEV